MIHVIGILEERFKSNMHRHPNIKWSDLVSKIGDVHIRMLKEMELTGGSPDLVVIDGVWYMIDCSKEAPEKRRNLCYDKEARVSRKKFPPETSAKEVLEKMGIEMLSQTLYEKLQRIEDFDLKTSIWLQTPEEIRKLGGALFGDKRYEHTFIYHNGADSYYGVRGVRGYFKI